MHGEQARRCLDIEARAVASLISRINGEFDKAIEMILACQGRVVVTGIGKSGLIGRKVSATLASTGTPSFFLHPSEGLHGDVGMVTGDDIVMAFSNSGDTAELLGLLPVLKRIGARIIALCGCKDGILVRNADLFLDVAVEQEACPLGLTPTASTTAALAMGDAIAMALLSARKFSAEDFAVFHPGGALGQKLLTVADHMHKGEDNPVIPAGKTVREALFVITAKGLGATSVIADDGGLLGLITDGDIRRGFEKGNDFLDQKVEAFMTRTPRTISPDELAAAALRRMEANKPTPITVLPVINSEGCAIGMLHITDLLRRGMV
ncbi:MAG: KpsF/GutQ family protein [Firmicutes bacterium]|nr:KpsF/GutQ family protein [Bacillota bacterium]